MTSLIQQNLDRILEQRSAAWKATGMPLAALAEARTLTDKEHEEFRAAEKVFEDYSERAASIQQSLDQSIQIDEIGQRLAGTHDDGSRAAQWINVDTNERAALRSNQSFYSHDAAQRAGGVSGEMTIAQFGNIAQMVRSLTTTGASAVVPTLWSSQLIDLARAESRVIQAGATVIPMPAKTVNIGRLTGDPTAAFRLEGTAIAASDPTFDNVTLDAKSMSALVIVSREWMDDSDNAESLVMSALAKQIALKIDQVALYGGIVAGAGAINLPTPLNPRGILAALTANRPANVLGAATNGTVQSASAYWSEVLDLLYTVRDANEEPTGLIWNTKIARQYAKATDTLGQPLNVPSDVAEVPRFRSNMIPSYTQGTMASRATDVFAGDFSKLLIGQRLDLRLEVLNERYADNGNIGLLASWRGDIQPARNGAFAVYRSLQGAA